MPGQLLPQGYEQGGSHARDGERVGQRLTILGCCELYNPASNRSLASIISSTVNMSSAMLTHSSCVFASRSCTRSMAPAPSAQLKCRKVATFEGMRSVGAVHKCAQTPLRAQRRAAVRASRSTPSIEAKQFKVALLGAAGGIGQPLALLLKMNKLVSELALYDVANVVGVAADLSHCNTPVKVLQHPD